MFADLPPDVLDEVFTHCDVESFNNLRLTCKDIYDHLDSDYWERRVYGEYPDFIHEKDLDVTWYQHYKKLKAGYRLLRMNGGEYQYIDTTHIYESAYNYRYNSNKGKDLATKTGHIIIRFYTDSEQQLLGIERYSPKECFRKLTYQYVRWRKPLPIFRKIQNVYCFEYKYKVKNQPENQKKADVFLELLHKACPGKIKTSDSDIRSFVTMSDIRYIKFE